MAKTINGSVGKGGSNRPEDVVIVQYLLNCVPKSQGGPSEELALDGICGSKTNAAILGFQKKMAGSGLGWLDAGGPTFDALSGFDPYPDYKLNLSGSKSSGKHVHKVKLSAASSSVKDPWGYYDPSGSKHMVKGYAPAAKMGGEQWKSGGKSGGGGGWKFSPQHSWKSGSSSPGIKMDGGVKQGWKLGGKESDASAGKGAGQKQGQFGLVKEAYFPGKQQHEIEQIGGYKQAQDKGGKDEFGFE